MLKHASIPIIDAGFAHLCVSYLDQSGYPVRDWLSQVHLPKAVIDNGEGYVSEYHLRKLMVMAEKRIGQEDLGLRVAQSASIDHLGEVGVAMSKATTLYDALAIFCREVADVNSHARFWLSRHEGQIWFCRANPEELEIGQRFAEQFTIMFMIMLVQDWLNCEWYPGQIWLKAANSQEYEKKPELGMVSFSYSRGISAIELPVVSGARISLPKQLSPSIPVPLGLSATLKRLLPLYFPEFSPNLEFAAELARLSSRTLKRRLAEENLSYSKLLSQTRFELACNLLKNTNQGILDIANAVSYLHPGNFTRAFIRWSGKTPQEYRRESNGRSDFGVDGI